MLKFGWFHHSSTQDFNGTFDCDPILRQFFSGVRSNGQTNERTGRVPGWWTASRCDEQRSGEKIPCWPSFPMRSRQSGRRSLPQSFDSPRHELPDSTGTNRRQNGSIFERSNDARLPARCGLGKRPADVRQFGRDKSRSFTVFSHLDRSCVCDAGRAVTNSAFRLRIVASQPRTARAGGCGPASVITSGRPTGAQPDGNPNAVSGGDVLHGLR
jgi:hypothetical protein